MPILVLGFVISRQLFYKGLYSWPPKNRTVDPKWHLLIYPDLSYGLSVLLQKLLANFTSF